MILVTGATGKIGTALLRELGLIGAPVRALVRDAAKAEAVKLRGAEVVLGDLARPETLAAALRGVETAFLLTAADPRQAELHGSFIAAAGRAGVRRVVRLSALGASPDAAARLARWHGESERDLERSGLAYTHLRPHFFMQNLLGFAASVVSEGALCAPAGEGRIGLVDARDIAAVAARALTEGGHDGKAYDITGPEALSFAEMARAIGEATARPVRYVDVPPEAARAGMVAQGLPEWMADALLELFAIYRAGRGARVTTVVRDVARKEPIPFARFAREHAAAFAPR